MELTIDFDRRRAGIAELTLFDPHLRPKHPKRRLMLIGNADGRSTYLLHADARAFDFPRCHLIKRQRIALEHRAVSIDQQQAQVILLKELTDALTELAQIVDGIAMLVLQLQEFLLGHPAFNLHRIPIDAQLLAPFPGLGHPGMYIGI